MERFEKIPAARLRISPTNPRKHFSEVTLREMADSMKAVGLIEPLVVRPIPMDITMSKNPDDIFEIVCGERRFRAADMAGIPDLICNIRELTDDQVFEIQITENLQRENVSPLDEAEAFQLLFQKKHLSVQEIATRFGKSEDYVFGRMRLTSLVPDAKRYLEEQLLPVTAAIRLSMLTEAQQKEAIKRTIIEVKVDDEPRKLFTGLRDLKIFFDNNVLVPLRFADFKVDDANLYPTAGTCIGCQYRTGNNLFQDMTDSDKCLKSECYKQKHILHYQSLAAELAKKMKQPIVFASRLYGIEREYKELGEIVPFMDYAKVESGRKGARYAVFIGPDRTREDGAVPIDHGWILSQEKKQPRSVETTPAEPTEDKEKKIRDGLIDKHYKLELYQQFVATGQRSLLGKSVAYSIAMLVDSIHISDEIIVDLCKRYKFSIETQVYTGKDWVPVKVNKDYVPDPKHNVSLDFDTMFTALESNKIGQSALEKMLNDLWMAAALNDESKLEHYIETFELDTKTAKKVARGEVNNKMKILK